MSYTGTACPSLQTSPYTSTPVFNDSDILQFVYYTEVYCCNNGVYPSMFYEVKVGNSSDSTDTTTITSFLLPTDEVAIIFDDNTITPAEGWVANALSTDDNPSESNDENNSVYTWYYINIPNNDDYVVKVSGYNTKSNMEYSITPISSLSELITPLKYQTRCPTESASSSS